jgi:hypothetical protein
LGQPVNSDATGNQVYNPQQTLLDPHNLKPGSLRGVRSTPIEAIVKEWNGDQVQQIEHRSE